MKKYRENRIFTLNNPTAPRICPELASEIGLNESILLLQYEFWLATVGVEREDGYVWVRKTIREIREVFEFWSLGTISNIRRSLLSEDYLISASLDHKAGKGADWIRFDFERLKRLRSISFDCTKPEQPMFKVEEDLVKVVNNRPLHKKRKIESTVSPQDSAETVISNRVGRDNNAQGTEFVLTEPMLAWATSRAPEIDLNLETEKFLNWVASKGALIRDWDAAWRNWIIRGLEYCEVKQTTEPGAVSIPLKPSDLEALLEA